MGTRCSIIVKDKHDSHTLYRSCDGYPEGAGIDLKTILEGLIHSCADEVATKIVQFKETLGYPCKSDYWYPFEIVGGIPGDVEYLYIVDVPTKKITCYSTGKLIGYEDKFTVELIVEKCEQVEIPERE